MAVLKPWQGKGDPTPRWRRLSWAVLIAYRVMRPIIGENAALGAIRRVLSGQFRRHRHAYLEDRFGITQDAPGEAFARIAANYQPRGERLFGSGFIYVQAVQEPARSHTHIRRCLFNDFFRAHGAPELTRVFCALDSIWVDELHQPRYGVRFERPTTLAAGGDACRFEFSRAPRTGESLSRQPDARQAVADGDAL
ncbi:MAG: L-2-amino-thiazoline-4-carboxylic acid hydrolase [Burkholderiales bacterium]|nr:L-2-amino-thiazoline-4-carboxylic acid hydrolase [Burkholderiales bacterium]